MILKKRYVFLLLLTVFLMVVNIVFLATVAAQAGQIKRRDYPESYYQNQYCVGWNGRQEVVLPDKTRADCVTDVYAMEFDFANKWAEGIGQALHYARITKKKGVLVLMIEDEEIDNKYYERARDNIEFYKLPLKIIRVSFRKGAFLHKIED